MHYAPSAVVNTTHQALAAQLIIGKRMPPHVFVQVADGRPVEIQDVLPADTRFKLLLFAGDTSEPAQLQKVRAFADALKGEEAFFKRHGGSDPWKVFDIQVISSASKFAVDFTDFPKSLCPHWSKCVFSQYFLFVPRLTMRRVLVDDATMYEHTGGKGYEAYGIDRAHGAIVVVRPDGYVGMVAPVNGIKDLGDYFSAFMKA